MPQEAFLESSAATNFLEKIDSLKNSFIENDLWGKTRQALIEYIETGELGILQGTCFTTKTKGLTSWDFGKDSSQINESLLEELSSITPEIKVFYDVNSQRLVSEGNPFTTLIAEIETRGDSVNNRFQ